jgi:hypothetical protein
MSLGISAQTDWPVRHFKVKHNKMYIALSRDLSNAQVDSFITKYNLGDIGLGRFMRLGKDDSLTMLGWFVDTADPKLYVITKKLEKAEELIKAPGSGIFLPVPTPEDWRVVGGNKVIYGRNDFKDDFKFKREGDVVYFELREFLDAKGVRLAGSFTNWQHGAFPMTRSPNGWVVAVKLKPGKYYYKFIVNDNRWITDPWNYLSENDGKGNENSVYFVTNKVFELKGYEDAKKVYVTGSFNNWVKNKIPMERTSQGWRTEVYLEPGTHTYNYIVDGKTVSANHKDKAVWASGNAHEFNLKGYKDAKKVVLAGNFNDWDKEELQMQRTEDGWKISYVLGPGNYQYKFIVDGNWITDPDNPHIVSDTKGHENSFIIIGANYKFRLKGFANANKVFLAGDFNDWSPQGLPMKKEGDEWVCPVYLAPGKHLYKFVVDGKWILDPANKNWEENEYGTGNSVLWIEEEV